MHTFEAINTLGASRFTLFMARIFGKKSTGYDKDAKIVLSKYKGKVYLLSYKQRKPSAKDT